MTRLVQNLSGRGGGEKSMGGMRHTFTRAALPSRRYLHAHVVGSPTAMRIAFRFLSWAWARELLGWARSSVGATIAFRSRSDALRAEDGGGWPPGRRRAPWPVDRIVVRRTAATRFISSAAHALHVETGLEGAARYHSGRVRAGRFLHAQKHRATVIALQESGAWKGVT